MGILRTDRVSGLGGANAIKGSVEFRAAQNLRLEVVNSNADFNLGSGDFTIECWYNPGGDTGTTDEDLLMLWNNTNSRRSYGLYYDNSGYFGFIGSSDGTNSDMNSYHSYNFPDANAWYHLAAVRISNTISVYINGVLLGTASTSASLYENTVDNLVIGGQLAGTNYDSKIARGFLSNVRMIKGDGIYTGAFTPPTNELTVTANTVLLACQSSGNILQEATGKTLIAYRSTSNDSFPLASTFTPNSPVGFSTTTDVGTQFGSTFDGVTTFDSQAYFVPPGGNTRERNRGRAIMAGGMAYPTANTNIIEMLEIQSGGMTQDFGDLITKTSTSGPVSSSTRGVIVSGLDPSARTNAIEFVTIASTGNATDFGDYVSPLAYLGGVSNQTRGVTCGGSAAPYAPNGTNQMAFITIATAGDATDYGDLSGAAQGAMGVQSSTRGVFNLGYVGGFVNTIEFITIATTGDVTDFGDLSRTNSAFGGACCSSTRGLFAGGYNNTPASVTEVNNIDFITIASTGNSTDFGDLVTAGFYCFGTSNKTRGIFQGRLTTAPTSGDPIIDSVTIASTGNAVEFGQMHRMDSGPADGQAIKRRGATTMSDSHGGLS